MQIIYLAVVFLVIIGLLAIRRPLYQAILGGLIVTAFFYQIPPVEIGRRTTMVITKWSSLSVLISLYLITFLQRILESRSQIKLAQQDLDGIFHNRRINTVGAALFIGLLPSAASMILCSDIVKDATDGYLEPKEQAVVASWFRHIPESALPTYTGVLLMLTLSEVPISQFLMGMIVPVIVLVVLGYVPYLRRLPKNPGTPGSDSRAKDVLHLFEHLWSLLLILVLILGFGFSVVSSVLISIVASILVYHIGAVELSAMFRSAFEGKMLSNTFLVLVLKEFIDYTGVLKLLPEAMAALPLPTYLVFALLFFVATAISGTTGAIAMGTPLAFAAIPGGMPLMVYLMCICHAASQVSPTHICLVIAADYFNVTLGELIRKTLPMALLFCILMTIYYNILLII
ncbi:DUF401 family protein [Clostridium sp. BSD9I1]|uniref:DUF401 family protein n=1 Tax=Clostridium sp. BSD9I1 TaxID=2003589 RepID=UPI001645896F|nr:DUF401 family protein [Clostridium sp. BSD9I1]